MSSDTDAIELSRCELKLVALLLGVPSLPRTLHVPGLRAAERTRELLVDEKSDTGFLGTWAQFIGRNQAANRRFNESEFRSSKIR